MDEDALPCPKCGSLNTGKIPIWPPLPANKEQHDYWCLEADCLYTWNSEAVAEAKEKGRFYKNFWIDAQ